MFKKTSLWAAATGNSAHAYRSLEAYDVNEDIVNPVTNEIVGETDTEIADIAVETLSISQEVDEIQRVASVTEAGEVISDVATQVASRDATPEEAALVQAGAAQTAIAAGATASDVAEVADQVASESNGKFIVSNESFVETIKNLWKKLKEWVVGLIQKIKNAWNRFWNSTESLKKKAKKLLDILKDKKDEKKEDKLEKWSGYFRNLATNGKFDPKDSLAEAKKLGSYVNKAIDQMITGPIKDMAGAPKETFTATDIDKKVEALMETFTGGDNVSQWLGNGYEGGVEKLPFGNKAVVAGYDGSQNITNTAKINSYTVRLVDHQKSFDPRPKEFKVDFFNKADVEDIAKSIDGLAKSLEDWYNKGSKDAEKKIEELRKNVDEKVNEINEGADAVLKEKVKVVQQMFRLPVQNLRCGMELCTYAIRVGNDMLSFGFLNAKNLKDKDD